jgi:hypothetical protein
MKKYKFADLVVELDYSKALIHETFQSFECADEETTQLWWKVVNHQVLDIPKEIAWIHFNGFSIGRCQDKVYASYAKDRGYLIPWIVYEENFTKVTYYLDIDSLDLSSELDTTELKNYLYAFHREAFFLGVLYQDGISIHSASILYRDGGIVFSAPSNTGKSTHTKMWNEQYHTPILDGDVTVCRWLHGEIYIYGLPWAGTSGLYLNKRAVLEVVVFLRQGPKNEVLELSEYEAFQQLFSRSFTPLWDAVLLQQRRKVTETILSKINQIYLLECLPNYDAVEDIKRVIDSRWEHV